MKRIKYILLFAIYVLALVNLAVALPKPPVSLNFNPDKVARIEVYGIVNETRFTADPVPKTDGYIQYTAPAAIEKLCDIFADLYIREYPYDEMSEEEQCVAQLSSQYDLYRFVMKNGKVEEFYLGTQSLRVGDHWCFASCGEKYGYQSVPWLFDDIERACGERINTEIPAS